MISRTGSFCSFPIQAAAVIVLLSFSPVWAGSLGEGFCSIGKIAENWKGNVANRGGLKVPGTICFEAPAGPKGWWNHGFLRENDSTVNGLPYAGLLIELEKNSPKVLELAIKLSLPPMSPRQDFVPESSATVRLSGTGKQQLWVPWSAFDFQQAQPAFLKFIQKIEIRSKFGDGSSGVVKISKIGFSKGETIALEAEVKSRCLNGPGKLSYPVTLINCSEHPQAVALSIQRHGWESMPAKITPEHVDLAPGQSMGCNLEVEVPDRVPLGGQEHQTLQAICDGKEVSRLDFITGRDLAHPYLLHTAQRWQEVREKIAKYDWAKKGQQSFIDRAEKWNVPTVAQLSTPPADGYGDYLFPTACQDEVFACGVSWQLTHKKAYAEKAALYLRRLSDPATGYPRTLRGCNQSLVQEGHFFKFTAEAYDMILDSGVPSEADKEQIEKTFRLYIATIAFEHDQGNISNWNLSELSGALFAALSIGDLERAWRLYEGPTGVLDQLGKGIMDDGWWYECAISYNGWMAQLGTEIAYAVEPWGKNLRTMCIPNAYTPNYGIVPWTMKPGLYGMSLNKFGPVYRNYVKITDLWDAFLPFVDYRGIIFGTNDSGERLISGNLYELAYYANRDPKYAAMIKYSDQRDLLWSVPELPIETPQLFRTSADSHNAGITVLRSQTQNRPQRQQIQAVLKYGTHGGFHGHFDRASLLSVMRYGRSFYNPEITWYGYHSFLYKFWCQTSLFHNMVVVDRKMQEPVESKRLIFHSGPMLQVAAAETNARWSYPPYGGIVFEAAGKDFLKNAYLEGRSMPAAQNPPKYGEVTGYTEPVLQRRLLAVTDDFIVVADYLKAEQEHDFDCLYQVRGLRGLEGETKLARQTPQWDTDPVNSAQLYTDCNWFEANGPVLANQEMRFSRGQSQEATGTSLNDPGVLKMNYHNVWPSKREVMIAQPPEHILGIEKRVKWRVRSGDKILAEGQVGTWAIGTAEIDVPVENLSSLDLEMQLDDKHEKQRFRRKTLFLANARLVSSQGNESPILAESVKAENTESAQPGKDYEGGEIVIAGKHYASAIPAEAKAIERPAVFHIDLSQQKAARFKATLGGDFPIGETADRLKTVSIHSHGKEARFLTVIEPHESETMIKKVEASGPDQLRVELADGRVQEIAIKNFSESAKEIAVEIRESKEGKVLRTETAHCSGGL